jgi:hypothetical protein
VAVEIKDGVSLGISEEVSLAFPDIDLSLDLKGGLLVVGVKAS